ncbi:MAG TPA: DUF3426 domain-containing protein [Bordetella sp.]|uniref:DUF3426 domain-containing protein n=1 Tax=Bordetella sp. TaxID=28081 RepID=UPI002ED1BECD
MALITRCPNCRTAFKVVADQLRVRNGLVRCGSCGTVFDGRACLEGGDVAPIPPAPQPIPTPAPSAAPVAPAAPAAPVVPAASPPPIEPPPFPSFLANSQAGSLVRRAAGSPAAGSSAHANPPPFLFVEPPAVLRGRDRRMPEQAPVAAESDNVREDEDTLESDAIHAEDEHEVAPSVGRAAEQPGFPIPARDAHDAHDAHVPIRAYDPEDYPADPDEPEFTVGGARKDNADEETVGEGVYGEVRTRYSSATDVGRAPPQFLDRDLIKSHHARRRLWTWLCMLGLIVLTGQLLYVYRTPISVSMPKLRPAFVGVCRALGCKVGYARRIERIWIESSSLRMTPQNNAQQAAQAPAGTPAGTQPAADGVSHMILGAVLRNRYEKDQEWPALDLKLRDKSDTVVAEKIIYPQDYLPPGATGPMAAGAEVPISVPIVVKGLQINGFGLQVFFPLNSPSR